MGIFYNLMHKIKSPLRYPGGKSKAVKQILNFLPEGLDTLCSPFLGGGSVELTCASEFGVKVYGYDAFKPVADFWQELLENPSALADKIRKYHPLRHADFHAFQNEYKDLKDRLSLAAIFYILNRASFSGTTFSGGMSPGHPRFTKEGIERLADFRVGAFVVGHADFKDSIAQHDNDFLYLDPPYANGKNLYGMKGDHHSGFDHDGLASILKKRERWLLSYNDCPMIRDLYNDFKIITIKWSYSMSVNKKSSEILITSHN